MKRYHLYFLFLLTILSLDKLSAQRWISTSNSRADKPNTWIAFRKDISLSKKPHTAITRIAADSKYWLWINGQLAVFEGGLKRGPNPNDTYCDEIDLAPFLRKGTNQIAVLLWYFGKDGYSHKDSGKSGLFFSMKTKQGTVYSDASWLSRIHPAYDTASGSVPNWRLAESNIRFTAEKDIPGWKTTSINNLKGFTPSAERGREGSTPWNRLFKRPIPFWKDFGIKEAKFDYHTENGEVVYTARLPYNMQMTPIIEVSDPNGNNQVFIETDHLYGGSQINLRAEYITTKGNKTYESLGWLNGEKIIIRHKTGSQVKINRICYRETGYDTTPEGTFGCDNDFYMRFWEKGLRTLYVNMRDNYFDCPDRERAQWWGDVVTLMGESFYTYSISAHALMKKAIYELADWQRSDSTLFSPIPAGNYEDELPAQMLTSIGLYGFWNYYMNTGDKETIKYVYPHVKKYLGIWQLDDIGLTMYRAGGWSWGDWGNNIDIRLILAGWHYMALDGAVKMAHLLGYEQDILNYKQTMKKIKQAYNSCWNGYAYRHPQYHGCTDDRVQALAVISGITGPERYKKISEVLKSQWYASPYMEKYIMEAFFQIGEGNYALKRIRERFAPMVNDKNHTTLFEDWKEGGAGGGSTNHAWSGGALTVIGQYLCGISPLEAGYSLFKVEPDPAGFKQTSISVPTVAGTIESAFNDTKDQFILQVTIPDKTEAIVLLPYPSTERNITVNGKASEKFLCRPDSPYSKTGKICYRLPGGKYILKLNK